MQAFTLINPANLQAAVAAAAPDGNKNDGTKANGTSSNPTKYIAGGTDLLQLLKDNVETPRQLVDLEPLGMAGINASPDGLHLEPLARMADVAAHPDVVKRWPVLSQALLASASPQIRNMGTMGGNLLQRTRCGYFRDTGFNCNKRNPGSGCPAINGENRNHAILGVSDQCIATYPGDMAVAMIVLDAELELTSQGTTAPATTTPGATPPGAIRPGTTRKIAIGDFHKVPGNSPHIETVLQPGEMITGIDIPASPAASRSHYLKVRDRSSFEFAIVSAAVALDIDGGTIRSARIAAGGVGTKPWRLTEVEAALTGKPATASTLQQAAAQAGEGAKPASMNGFKPLLLRRTVLRALQTVSA
jgi:xanthine dehydrogenase YagS FAD-binding subunit